MKYCFKKIMILCALLTLAGAASACRPSPVLEKVVYVDQSEQTDPNEQQTDPSDQGRETQDLENKTTKDADRQRKEKQDQGRQGDQPQTASAADVQQNNKNNIDDYSMSSQKKTAEDGTHKKSESDGKGSADATNSKTSDDSGKSDDSASDKASGKKDSASSDKPSGKSDESDSDKPSDESDDSDDVKKDPNAVYRQIADASGRQVDVPENVDAVTAVGSGAQMVSMLGEKGTLIGTNQAFQSSSLARAACEGLNKTSVWWSGDGDSTMSDSNFSKLLAASPGVCFYINGQNTFSDRQLARLEKRGIAAFALYAPTSVDNLKKSAKLVGKVLGDSAAEKAEKYSDWIDEVLDDAAGSISEDFYSLYLADWDASVSYQLGDTHGLLAKHSSGTGLAMAFSPKKEQILSTFMSAAGVSNVSTSISGHKSRDYVYVTPMFRNLKVSVKGSAATYYSGSGETGVAYDLFISRGSGSSYTQLGSSAYPAVIVSDSSVKSKLENNWFWKNKDQDGDGRVDEDPAIYSGILGSYDIYINPSGLGDWAVGSVDAPLEAYWIACKFQKSYSMSEVKEKTKEFYQEFFGTTLSSSQLRAIYGE